MSTGELQGTQQSGESGTDYAAMYKEQHPNAVEDVDKAHTMALASSSSEEEIVALANKAKEVAERGGLHDVDLSGELLTEARSSRIDADKQAEAAAVKWEDDQVKKRGIIAQADRLKAGERF